MQAWEQWHEDNPGAATAGELYNQYFNPIVRGIDMLELARNMMNGFGLPGRPGQEAVPPHWNPGAWTEYQACPTQTGFGKFVYSTGNAGTVAACIRGQARGLRRDTFGEFLAYQPNTLTIGYWEQTTTPGFPARYGHHRSWSRPNTTVTTPFPEFVPETPGIRAKPRPIYQTLPPGLPAWAYPPGQPVPLNPRPAVVPDPTPSGTRLPPLRPYERPALITSGGKTRIGKHKQLPPKAKEREKKGRYKKPGWLEAIVGTATETADIIEALDKSLPPDKRCRGGTGTRWGQAPQQVRNAFGRNDRVQKGRCTPQAMAANLWANANHIQVEKFAAELIKMKAEDKVLGLLGKAGADLARKGGWLVGPQTGFAM